MRKTHRSLRIVISLALLGLGAARASDQLDAAGQAFNRGDYTQAIKLFQAAPGHDGDCNAFFYIGLSHYRLHQLDDAIINLASAAGCEPQSIEFNTALAEAYAEKGDDNRALTTYGEVLKLSPSDTTALRAVSILYMRHDMSDEALPVLQKLVAIDQKDATARAGLAAAYAAHGQFTEAERFFEEALTIDPGSVPALVGLGNVILKTDRFQQAVDVLSRAIRLDPKAYEPLVLRARAYGKLRKFEDALVDFKAALRLGAVDPEIHYYLFQTYRSMGREGDSQRALADFEQLRSESNRSVEVRREAARLTLEVRRLVDAGDLAGAITMLEKARDMDSGNPSTLFRLAGLYFENHQYNEAEASVRAAIGLAPSQWDYHYLEGLIEEGVGQFGPAQVSLETAARLNPGAAEVHNQLGDLALRRDDTPAALQEYTRAAHLAPEQTVYQANVEKARRLLQPPARDR